MATRIKPAVQTVELRTGMRHRTLLGDAVRRFTRNRLAMLGLLIVLFLLFLAVFADVIAPYPYDKTNFSVVNLLPFVNPAYPLGADAVGRDYLSRLIYGARTSMLIGLSVPLIGFTIGITLGVLAGFYGGRFDMIVQRLVEIFTAVPPLLLALFMLSLTAGSGVGNVILVLALTSWIEPTRLTRAQFLTFREKEFVSAARALGATDLRLVLAHVLPNALTPLLVAFTFAVPTAIFAEAGLSFLGIGITEPTASWGKMVGNSVGSTIRIYYHLALFPTLLVALTMLGFSFVGDGLQEALDPSRTR
jgi:oligopeptide transport system permease protein